MKIGIMSMQRICNYGSFLQAYCLKMILEEMGHTVTFTDYRPGPVWYPEAKGRSMKRLKGLIKEAATDLASAMPLPGFLPASVRYSLAFKKNYRKRYLKDLGITPETKRDRQDVLVIGSDEVWNCFQKNPKTGYCLDLFGKESVAKTTISYAASFGNTTEAEIRGAGKEKELAFHLNRLDGISVRDENSGNIVKSLTGKTPAKNLDPVLMYEGLARKIPNERACRDNYLLVYAYRNRITAEEAGWILRYADEHGLKVVSAGGYQDFSDIKVSGNPFRILGMIKNASCVVTDTFHGSIFSVITRRPFAAFVRNGHGSVYGNSEKLNDLLRTLRLEDRRVSTAEEMFAALDSLPDYEKTEKILEMERKKTKEYLEKNIGKER